MASAPANRHIVAYVVPMWGHARPLSILLARLVKLRPVDITVVVPIGIYDRVKGEISRDFAADEMPLMSRIQIISVNQDASPFDTSVVDAAYQTTWDRLSKMDEPLICAKTGVHYEPPSPPCAVIVDAFSIAIFNYIHEYNPRNAKLVTWWASSMTCFFYFFQRDLVPLIEEEVARTGRPFDIVACEIFHKPKGELIEGPCLPPVYDHELSPQNFPTPPALVGRVLVRVPSIAKRTRAIITFDAANYHPENTAALRAHLANTSQAIYYAGPLIPSGTQAAAVEQRLSQGGDDIMAFLDKQLTAHGPRSVIYVTFGSLFWPRDASRVWGMLDVFMERKIPFIMSHAAALPWATMPDDIKEKIAAYGDGIVSKWVPQQQVLEHSAVGWGVSHGGHNSVLEFISAGIPMILWPVAADQPVNTIHLTDDLKVAYELLEVRHGSGLGPIYRRNGKRPTGTVESAKAELRDTLDRAFGKDGEEKRRNIGQVREKLDTAWSYPEGVARRDVEAFLDDVM